MTTKAELLKQLKIPRGYEDILDKLSVQEILTQRCDDCNTVIEVHDDGAWRWSRHVIRCEKCTTEAVASGHYTAWEARYVV